MNHLTPSFPGLNPSWAVHTLVKQQLDRIGDARRLTKEMRGVQWMNRQRLLQVFGRRLMKIPLPLE